MRLTPELKNNLEIDQKNIIEKIKSETNWDIDKIIQKYKQYAINKQQDTILKDIYYLSIALYYRRDKSTFWKAMAKYGGNPDQRGNESSYNRGLSKVLTKLYRQETKDRENVKIDSKITLSLIPVLFYDELGWTVRKISKTTPQIESELRESFSYWLAKQSHLKTEWKEYQKEDKGTIDDFIKSKFDNYLEHIKFRHII